MKEKYQVTKKKKKIKRRNALIKLEIKKLKRNNKNRGMRIKRRLKMQLSKTEQYKNNTFATMVDTFPITQSHDED